MVQLLIWIIPPVFYFIVVWFFRSKVEEPHISRIWYWGTVLMFVPILGLFGASIVIMLFVYGMVTDEIEFKKDTKFAKRWLD